MRKDVEVPTFQRQVGPGMAPDGGMPRALSVSSAATPIARGPHRGGSDLPSRPVEVSTVAAMPTAGSAAVKRAVSAAHDRVAMLWGAPEPESASRLAKALVDSWITDGYQELFRAGSRRDKLVAATSEFGDLLSQLEGIAARRGVPFSFAGVSFQPARQDLLWAAQARGDVALVVIDRVGIAEVFSAAHPPGAEATGQQALGVHTSHLADSETLVVMSGAAARSLALHPDPALLEQLRSAPDATLALALAQRSGQIGSGKVAVIRARLQEPDVGAGWQTEAAVS